MFIDPNSIFVYLFCFEGFFLFNNFKNAKKVIIVMFRAINMIKVVYMM